MYLHFVEYLESGLTLKKMALYQLFLVYLYATTFILPNFIILLFEFLLYFSLTARSLYSKQF